jgi:hypothetical protein
MRISEIRQFLEILALTEAIRHNSPPEAVESELDSLLNTYFMHTEKLSTKGHNIITSSEGNRQIHYTGDIKNKANMSAFKRIGGVWQQDFIYNKQPHENGVKDGNARNLNHMLDQGHTVVSSGMISNHAERWYNKFYNNNKDKVAFTKFNAMTKEETPINSIDDIFDNEGHTLLKMKRK